jgi:hypothetical protein
MQRLKNSRRFAVALVLITTGVVSAIAGSAGTGSAAPGITFKFEPLIGTNNINEIPKVSYGKGIGFHLLVQNGTNSAPHATQIVVTNNDATYDSSAATFNGGTVFCTAGSNGHVLTCPLPDTLVKGDTFEAFIRFIAPPLTSPAITQVSTTAALSVSAQTVGGSNNNGRTLASGTLKTDLTSEVTTENAYLKNNESASTLDSLTSGHPQNFTLTTPSGLLKGAFGVAVGITDRVETPADPCVGSLISCTTLTIPNAHFVNTPGNPFYDSIAVPPAAAPYTWSMNATFTGGPPSGVVHVDDAGHMQQLKDCATIGGPSAAEPLCVNLPLVTDNNPKVAHATGQGLENGELGFG